MTNKPLLYARCGLVLLILVGVGVLIHFLVTKSELDEIPDLGIEPLEIDSTSSPLPVHMIQMQKCLIQRAESPYFPINQLKNTSCAFRPGQCMHYVLIHFSEFMDSLGIKLYLIEPALLFCLQPSVRKFNLLTRGFSPIKFQGSRNVMTFGIVPSEAEILDRAQTRLKIAKARYRILRFPKWMKSGLIDDHVSERNVLTVHYFIISGNLVMHLVTLYPRGTYLWSPSFDSTEMNITNLLYVNNSAFEKFPVSPMNLSITSEVHIYLPSDVRNFLLDMMSSKFLECEVDNLNVMSVENANVPMALKELKIVLASQMVIFWLWSRSLQGWYEKCDVLQYSSELNFAIAAKSVEGYNFTALFTDSECQHVENHSNLGSIVKIELKCHGRSLNIFLMYEDEQTYWYEHFDGQNTYKLSFPKFTLCSADVLNFKINVPCETSEIFNSEYAQFLKNATLHLNPESMKNVMLETST